MRTTARKPAAGPCPARSKWPPASAWTSGSPKAELAQAIQDGLKARKAGDDDSASAASTGRCPGVWPCNGKKNWPSGKPGASRCAACTANAVLPTPAMPPMAWMPTTPPSAAILASAPISCASSAWRPVNAAISRQRPGGRRRERPRRHPLPGRQHIGGGPAPGGAAANSARRAGQAQCIGQQPGRVLAGGAVDSPLQVADRPRGQARRRRQVLLGQPGLGPQLPQQAGKPQPRLLRHRSSAPRTPPAVTGRHEQNTRSKPTQARPSRPPAALAQAGSPALR